MFLLFALLTPLQHDMKLFLFGMTSHVVIPLYLLFFLVFAVCFLRCQTVSKPRSKIPLSKTSMAFKRFYLLYNYVSILMQAPYRIVSVCLSHSSIFLYAICVQ